MSKRIFKTLILDIKQTCEFIKVSRATLYRYMKNGELPYLKIHGSIRFYEQDVLKFLDSKRVTSNPQTPHSSAI